MRKAIAITGLMLLGTMAPASGLAAAGMVIQEEDVASRVSAMIAAQLGVDAEAVTPRASFTADLGAESLQCVELVMAIEEEFGLVVGDEDSEKLQTVGDMIFYVEKNYARGSADSGE